MYVHMYLFVYIQVVPMSTTQARPVAPKPVTTGQRILIPAAATTASTRPGQTLTTIPASALSQLQGNKVINLNLKLKKVKIWLTVPLTLE